jgi:hypothetical protein
MPLNKEKALREIDEVRHWDGPSAQVETFAIIALETIRRWSPPNSTYVEKAEQEFGGEEQGYELMRVLDALKWQIEHDRLADFAAVVHADLFADLLAQSEHLLDRKYRRAAATLAGSVLEEQLAKMTTRAGLPLRTDRGPLTAGPLNASLYTADVYTLAVKNEVDAWLAIRNPAAHGDPDFDRDYNDAQVKNMIDRVRTFIVDHPA